LCSLVVSEFATRIPPGLGPEERAKRLKSEAKGVLAEWHKYTSDLPSFTKEALIDSALEKAPD